ncbi:MAG: substrate-binding domain-containing protein, partial [Rhodobacteraceae bacterium]|nr:substrate-binding domain-containing protein [Paracoccaceae bacterium]
MLWQQDFTPVGGQASGRRFELAWNHSRPAESIVQSKDFHQKIRRNLRRNIDEEDMMFPSSKKGLLIAGTALATLLGVSAAAAEDMVALLLPENVNPRWEQQDAAAFVSTMKEIAPGVKVEVFNANNDTSVQQRQAEQALTQGAKVLVVIPIDGESSAVIADMAAEEDVPTIAYDR